MVALILGLMVAVSVATPAPKQVAEDAPLLAGPAVKDAAPAKTLVHFGADGRLIALENREEIEAVELLGLSDAEREPIDQYIRLRLADVTAGGIRRIPFILGLREVIASGSDERIDDVLKRFGAHREIWKTSPEEVISKALPERARREYARLIEQYREAWIAEKSRESKSDRATLLARLEREKKIADIERPAQASAAQARERFERISRRLDLTSEQEGKLQTLLQEYATNSNFNPRPRDGLKLLADMFGVLTWEQRLELRRYLQEERGEARFRPLRDAPKGAGMAAGVPVMLLSFRRKRRRIG
ncbi:MAG: hypothetical protein KF691_03885 [Phycisphaeraceae bacterium]|nr:hypothetical protein [Phycisphaeraceae bacterium]